MVNSLVLFEDKLLPSLFCVWRLGCYENTCLFYNLKKKFSCGKKFKSELDAQAHAARTKHTNFSESTEEIKPMTEEEKKDALAR